MPAIFISYRREDSSAVTSVLASSLATRFGDDMVFLDVQAIEAGADFSQAILDAVRAASVVLVVIGPRWLADPDGSARPRLEDPGDFVRLEIETAMKWGAPIIPVLVSGAVMPEQEALPASIRSLSMANAFTLHEETTAEDAEALATQIATTYGVEPAPKDARTYVGGRIKALRRYPFNFAKLLRRPKRMLATRTLGRTQDAVDALVFLTLSTALAAWLMIAELPVRSWGFWFSGVSAGILAVLLFSIPLYWSWRLVGARPDYGRVFTILCYQISVIHVGLGFAALVFFFYIKFAEPRLLRNFSDALIAYGVVEELTAAAAELYASPTWSFAWQLLLPVPFLMLFWYVLCWGAYRRSLGLGRLQSGLAFILSSALMLAPVVALMFAIGLPAAS